MVRTPILSDDRDQMKEGARTQDATRHTVEANEIERARAHGLPQAERAALARPGFITGLALCAATAIW